MSNSLDVTLRPAIPDDKAFLVGIYGSTREQELAMVPWTLEQRDAFIRFQYDAQLNHYQTEYPKAEHSVILVNGEPVGRLYIDRRETQIRILDITLLTSHRGKGIGTLIIRHVMQEAAASGKTVSINLDLFSFSQRLFERLGFKPTEKTDFHTLYLWQPESIPVNG